MATNTSLTTLSYSTDDGTTYEPLCEITSYPDLFTPPPKLDVTTLSNSQRVYIPDIADVPDLTFGAFYDETVYDTIKGLEGTEGMYKLEFGEAGAQGAWTWDGDVFVTPKGAGVGAAREMEITCYPATEITKETA